MRDKLVDLGVDAAAATNAGFITNSAEIRREAREEIERVLSKPLLPND